MRGDIRFVPDRFRQLALRNLVAAFCAVWIAAMLFVQWLVSMPTSALYVESKTQLPLTSAIYFVRGNLSKPLSPPNR
jgi:hypothetical protein